MSGQQQSQQQQPLSTGSSVQYTASSRYRGNDNNNSRAGFGGSKGMRLGNYTNNDDEPQNIMYDRRVIRGSTLALRRQIESRLNDINQQSINSNNKKIRKSTFKRRMKVNRKNDYKNSLKLKSPRPVDGRLHAEIQTDPYLEEIHVSKHEKDFGTQTDPFLDRPSTPLFIPKLSGKCVATQIEDGDLFDFDREVEPILEVLIGKTVEQSLMEVLEEQELKSFAKYKAQFQQKRNVELVKCQRLEEEQRRADQEKQRRIIQAQEQKEEEERLKKRIEAQRIATEFLENIENAVFEELDKRGHFYDPIKKEIETIFIPKLLTDVKYKVNETKISNMIMEDVVMNVVKNMINNSIQIIKERDDEKERLEKEEIIKKKLEEKFVEKRKEFTQAIKSQKEDYDFKQQIIGFLDIPITAPPKEDKNKAENGDKEKDDDDKEDVEEDNDGNDDEEEQELPPEIQKNIEYIDGLIEEFGNDEEPLWKQIKSMLDKIGGETSDKIAKIDQYLEKFSIKLSKKELLNMFQIYKEDEENLKKAIIDCLGTESFNEEIHNKFLEAFKGEEQKDQMECIDELIKEKQDIKQFVVTFVKQKEEERIAAEEAAKAKEAAENEEAEEDED